MNKSIRKRSRSIRQPLILILLVISLVPLLGIGLFVIYRGITLARYQMNRQEQEYLEKTSMRLEACMQDMETYFSSASAQENLQKYYYQKLDYREYSSLIAVQRMFRNFLEQQSLIDSVYYVSFENNFFIGSQSADYFEEKSGELLQEIEKKGVSVVYVTLHVGLGTFRPVKEENVLEHHMHSEFYQISEDAAKRINETKQKGGRVICVGTTSCRTLESAGDENGVVHAGSGDTEIFIYPGYRFKVLDALITNFHLPESTLVMLVSALAGREHVLRAYEEAIQERYRFFSFGDAMFIQ